jgi:hypothetical protein
MQYILANLGISPNFGFIDFAHLTFPTTMRIDYIRVYQPKDQINYGCDPEGFPTEAYINTLVALFIIEYMLVADLSPMKLSRGVQQPQFDDLEQ